MFSSLYVCINFLMNYPAAEQRGINRNIHNRPKARVIKTLSGSGGFKKGPYIFPG